jgi:putative ABC transport system substrate-binding protein
MRRREFISLLGGAAAWPVAAWGQQGDRVRRIGVLSTQADNDPDARSRIAAFRQQLQQLGWTDGRNVRIDERWAGGDVERSRRYAAELVALAPDVILVSATLALSSVMKTTRTVPIVFTSIPDPVGGGFVDSLARPGGNATGFMPFEYGLSVKWLELLKQIAPAVTRAAVLRDLDNPAGGAQFGAIQAVSSSLGMEVSPIDVRDFSEIERRVASFARSPNGGLIVTGSAAATVHRHLFATLAAQHKLPAVYPNRFFVAQGALISYGPNFMDQYGQAADYVDRILKGAKPADMPVQAPTKYELAINRKTANALGLSVPPMLLARADEVIE